MTDARDLVVDGNATAYRLVDVGYSIDLDAAARLLGGETRGRSTPKRAEARAFQIRNPPLSAALGERTFRVGDEECTAAVFAHLFDFGVCSLGLTLAPRQPSRWSEYAEFGARFDASAEVRAILQGELEVLLHRIGGSIERGRVAPVLEDYVLFRIHHIEGVAGQPAADLLTHEHLAPLLLGERRQLSADAQRELLTHRFTYYADDLTVVTWDNALIVDPQREDNDVEFVLEFANAQLLELRVYDSQLDAELPRLNDRIEAARRRRPRLTRRLRELLTDVQITVADITEVVERADNAFKVTDDVYLARIYASALEIFRQRAWRSGIDRKLGILRDAYTMLNAEAQAARAELLEVAIVVLIVIELALALVRY